MSRNLSTSAINAMNAAQTGDVFLTLLTLDHASLDTPIRVVNNNEDITSNGNTFIAYPFEIIWADDRQDAPPVSKLSIDNVDRILVEAIRSITSAASVSVQIVRDADPDTIEAEIDNLFLKNITGNAYVIEGDLISGQFATEGFPAHRFAPHNFPGIF